MEHSPTIDSRLPLPLLAAGAVLLPAIAAALLFWLAIAPYRPFPQFDVPLRQLPPADVQQLERLLSASGLEWPPSERIPAVMVTHFPAEIGELPADRKKSLFFRALLPLVVAENDRIRRLRTFAHSLLMSGDVEAGSRQWDWLLELAGDYGVAGSPDEPQFAEDLLRRLDVVPAGLVLAQAANESAWGTSRFVREGNNIFGQWTWNPARGIVPLRRPEGATHYVRVFADLRASVRAYLKNMNSGQAYGEFRRMRELMRRLGQPLDAYRLAGGLLRYSQRGEGYVEEIRAMIRSNGLSRLGPFQLVERTTAG